MTDHEGTPRTWTLNPRMGVIHVSSAPAGSPRDEDLVEVIEKEPVLDALEVAIGLLDADMFDRSEIEPLRALLRAHGRLKGEHG
jgi:hypothetical protein